MVFVKSIFQFTKDGYIKATKQFQTRYDLFKETFNKWLNEIPNKELTIEHLFYDKV